MFRSIYKKYTSNLGAGVWSTVHIATVHCKARRVSNACCQKVARQYNADHICVLANACSLGLGLENAVLGVGLGEF